MIQSFFSHPIPALLILLGVLVFIHELGHYLAGVWAKVGVEIFSIGFGPKIISFRRGVTDYRISAIPLGGFVKFYGANDKERVPEAVLGKEYYLAPVWKRMIIVAAGPIANFLLAIAVFTTMGAIGIQNPPAQIGDVMPESPAAEAGIEKGDVVTSIDGDPIKAWTQMERRISLSPGKMLELEVQRFDILTQTTRSIKLNVTPRAHSMGESGAKEWIVGRAGVSLGLIPPVIAMLQKNAFAYQIGLRTSDRVEAVVFKGQRMTPRSYADFYKILQDLLLQKKTKNFVVEVKRDNQKIDVNFDALKQLPKDVQALGFGDGQMIVREAQDKVADALKKNDVILKWDGKPMRNYFDLRDQLLAARMPNAELLVLRDNAEMQVFVPLKSIDVQRLDGPGTMYTLPVAFLGQPEEPPFVTDIYPFPFKALRFGFEETGRQTLGILRTMGQLVTGKIPARSLGGPILIAKVASESVKAGLQTFLSALALISINLGVVNLFPIPVLDGGQLILLTFEKIRRRRLPDSWVELYQRIGVLMVLSFVALAMFNDISRFWRSLLG